MDKALRYLGIAVKAGLLEIGEENSGAAVRNGKCRVLLLAEDASDNAAGRAQGYVRYRSVPLIRLPFTKEQIAEATGKSGCSMATVTDVGLASAVLDALAETDADRYGAAAADMKQKNDRAARRRTEAAAHERNKRAGKRRKDK